MATIEECRAAVQRLADHLADNADARGRVNLDRRISVDITDLGTGFHGRLFEGHLVVIMPGADPHAKINLAAHSDDLAECRSRRACLTS